MSRVVSFRLAEWAGVGWVPCRVYFVQVTVQYGDLLVLSCASCLRVSRGSVCSALLGGGALLLVSLFGRLL